MRVYTSIKSLKKELEKLSKANSIGFVPTMGALHQGHLSLVEKAKEMTDIVVVSIFVNPTQFDKQDDLDKYPVTIDADLELLEKVFCDIVFIPSVKEIYADTITSGKFDFEGLDRVMEGEHRAGHFDGVGTIVKRLFEIVEPNMAFFGEKDFQQLQIVKKMVKKEHFPIHIVGVPIYRESDGLAMSSRNTRLTKAYRKAAPFIHKTLQKAKEKFGTENAVEVEEWVKEQFEKHPLLEMEYFTIAEETSLLPIRKKRLTQKYRAFIAVFAGDIRLIDNIAL